MSISKHCTKGVLGFFVGVLVTGCTLSYEIAGRFEGTSEQFFGVVVVSLLDTGSIDVQTRDGSVVCTGSSKVTEKPSMGSKIGARGMAFAECNDGRTFKVDFVQTSESGGHGHGIDNTGEIVKVYFDQSHEMAVSRMQTDLLDSLVQ